MDKMYLMLPEFTVSKYNMENAKKDYIKYNKTVNALMNFIESVSDLEESDENFQEWFSKNKNRYLLNPEDWKIRKIKYDYSKKPQEQSKQARNNALIDMYFGVLTNKNTIHKLLNPGGYENIRKAAYTVILLKSENKKQILEYIKTLRDSEGNLKYDVTTTDSTITSDMLFINLILNKLIPEDIISIYKKFKPKTDPLSPQTWVDIHQRNMMGASLVPIYANSNANHAVIQHTNLHVNLNKAIKINGKEKTSLHEIIDKENKLYISRNTSEYLAAAVDNAKDAILGLLNLNLATADSSSYLSRLGFTHMEVGLLISQPAILEAVEYYNKHKREGITFLNAIDTKIEEYYAKATNKKGARNFKITTEWLAQNLIDSANPERNSIEYDRNLFIVLVLFSNILEGSLALSQVVSSMRSDTKNGAAGPDIATTITKILKIVNTVNELDTAETEERFNTSVLHGGKGIITVPEISLNMSEEQYDRLREYLLSTNLPYMNAFTTLGVFSVVNFFDKYFPQTSLLFNSIVNYIETQSIKGKLDVKTMNSIFNDVFTFYLQSISNNFFNPERIISYQYNGKQQERTAQDYFVNVFPIIFQKFKDKYGTKLNLDFVNRIVYVKPHEGTPITTLQFKTVGKIDERLKLEYKQLWGYMVNHSDPEVRKMARDLFLYNFFNSGYAFSGVSFMHLVPTVLKENLYGGTSSYIEDLYNIFEITDDSVFEESLIGNKYKEFAELFIYNRLYSNIFSKFLDVYVLAKDKHVIFFKEGLNKINDTVEVNLNLKSSNAEINKIVKDKYYDYELRKEIDVPIRFFRIKIDIQDYYYELQRYDRETGRAIYRRVTPLGFKNRVVEYSYNKDALDCTSVLFCNNPEYVVKTKRKNNYEDYEFSIVPEMPSYLGEYYNNAGDSLDYAVGNSNTNDDDYMPLLISVLLSQVQELQAAQGLFRGVLGEDLDLSKKDTNMNLNNYPQNEEYKDVNGKPICK